MAATRKLGAIALMLPALSVLMMAAPAAAERALARALQSVVPDFDREGLEPGVAVRGDDGILRPAVRCGTRPVADFERQFIAAAVVEQLRSTGTEHRLKEVVIPVHFHILRKKNGSWDVTDEQIAAQLDVLNRSFAEHGFTFRLDGVSRHDNNRYAKKCLNESVEEKFKKRFAVDPASTLNIYTCRPQDDVLGYAYYPSDYPEPSSLHGVVLLHSTLPGGSAFPYDLGDTAVHEVGHYLGLYHTFEGGCSETGDRIADTAREKRPAAGCPVTRDTCPQPGLDPVTNFMDYSDDDCVEEFTADQEQWMKDQVETFKPGLSGS